MKETIFVCKIKIIGAPFAVRTQEEAEKWVSEDPESNVYDELEIKDLTD